MHPCFWKVKTLDLGKLGAVSLTDFPVKIGDFTPNISLNLCGKID